MNDALQMLAFVPDSSEHNRLTSQVGTGSDEHCLSGEPMMIFETSDGGVSRKTSRADVAHGWIKAAGEFCMALQMLSTLFRK